MRMEILSSTEKNFTLTKLDALAIPDNPREIRVFLIAHNEYARLPFLLNHYRQLGVSRFFIVDDNSNDGSREFLLQQNDCHIFHPSNSYKESRSGLHWRKVLMDAYGIDQWCLILDADEILVYPHCETVRLRQFCDYLDSVNSNTFFAFMLDMYAGKNAEAVCVPGKAFYEVCPYFDKDYKFRTVSPFNKEAALLPEIRVVGGPRLRLFYPFQRHTGFISRMILSFGIGLGKKLAFIRNKPHYAPALIKVPLLKWQADYKRLTSHVMEKPENGSMAEVTGALLHFKFFSDFDEKAKNHIAKGQYYNGSQEYRRYLAYMLKNPDFSFLYKGSLKYADSNSVLGAGLIKSTKDYDRYASEKQAV